MKIAHISSRNWHPCFWDLVLEQNKIHPVHYIYLDLCAAPDYSPKSSHRNNGILYTSINCRSHENFEYDNKLRDVLSALFKTNKPDVIHLQLFSGISVKPILNVASSLGIRTIITLHDHTLLCIRGTLHDGRRKCNFEKLSHCDCQEQHSFSNVSKQTSEEFYAWRLKNIKEILTMCDAVICPSFYQKRMFEKLLGPNNKLIVLPYGVNLNIDSKQATNKRQYPVFGYLGTLSPLKGLSNILTATKPLKTSQYKMLLGIYAKKYDRSNSSFLTKLKKKQNIRVFKRIRHKFLYEKFLKKIDCLIVPSIWEETGPMTLIEAIYCKIPVIVANQDSMTEKTRGYPNAFIFNTTKELTSIMRKIVQKKIQFKKTKRSFVKNIAEYASEIEQIYTKVLHKDSKMLVLNTGYICNNHCIFCVTGDNLPKQFVDLAILKKNLIEFRRKYDQVTFTGGEPTIRKDFFDLLEIAYQLGYKITLQTNGRIFSDKELCKKTAVYNITVYTHLESYKSKIHDAITNICGSYWETLRAIKNLKNTGHAVYLKVMLTKFNYRQLSLTAKFINRLHADGLWIVSLCADGYADIFFNQITPKYSETKQTVHKTLRWIHEKTAMKIKLEGFPFCFIPPNFRKYMLEYNVLNRKKRLCVYPLEKKQKEAENFSLEKRLELKQKVAQCHRCRLSSSCEGIYKSYVREFGEKEFEALH